MNCAPLHIGKSAGITILELLAAVAVVAILGSIGMASFSDASDVGEVTKARMELRQLAGGISAYQTFKGRLPLQLSDTGMTLPVDPWGNAYVYLPIEGVASTNKGDVRKDKSLNPINTDYDLYSKGPDGETKKPLVAPQSKDDIVRAGNGSFYGVAENF